MYLFAFPGEISSVNAAGSYPPQERETTARSGFDCAPASMFETLFAQIVTHSDPIPLAEDWQNGDGKRDLITNNVESDDISVLFMK